MATPLLGHHHHSKWGLKMDTSKLTLLFPGNPLRVSQPDPDYAEEYTVAKSMTNVRLINLDCLLDQNQLELNTSFPSETTVIYRGWMLRPETYSKMNSLILASGAKMLTDTHAYTGTHLLPRWAHHSNTLKSAWTTDLSDKGIIRVLNQFSGPVTIKDFVKSRKHEWYSAFYIPNAQNFSQALEVIHNFITRQGENLVGGLVIREFVPLLQTGTYLSNNPTFEEYRVFYWQRNPFVVIDYWGKNFESLNANDQQFIKKQGADIKSSFFTIDFARKINGDLTIMEIGDAQVSGLQNFDVNHFYRLWLNQI